MVGATMGAENTLGILPILWTTWFCGFFFVSWPLLFVKHVLNGFSRVRLSHLESIH
jgi:hypothetical protein